MGALSKLVEFLLNPQVRTCSVAVPGKSRKSNSENRETTGDCSSDAPCPEVRFSSNHFGHLNSPEVKDYPHSFPSNECVFLTRSVALAFMQHRQILFMKLNVSLLSPNCSKFVVEGDQVGKISRNERNLFFFKENNVFFKKIPEFSKSLKVENLFRVRINWSDFSKMPVPS